MGDGDGNIRHKRYCRIAIDIGGSAVMQVWGGVGVVGTVVLRYTCRPGVASSKTRSGDKIVDKETPFLSTRVLELREFASCLSNAS